MINTSLVSVWSTGESLVGAWKESPTVNWWLLCRYTMPSLCCLYSALKPVILGWGIFQPVVAIHFYGLYLCFQSWLLKVMPKFQVKLNVVPLAEWNHKWFAGLFEQESYFSLSIRDSYFSLMIMGKVSSIPYSHEYYECLMKKIGIVNFLKMLRNFRSGGLNSVLDLSFETEEPRKICFKSACFLIALHIG